MPAVERTSENGDSPLPLAVSVVLPCYNEASCLRTTVPQLVDAFASQGDRFEIILVDNGSTDDTGQTIDDLVAATPSIRKATVEVNRGQGLGIRTGLNASRGRIIGYVNADGQVLPEDVVRVYLAGKNAPRPVLSKARREDRHDGIRRAIISLGYNALMKLFFPGMPSSDVNANPKFLPAECLSRMDLLSDDWFLEAEVMLKAQHMRLDVVEVDVAGMAREAGRSHVRNSTILEFVKNMVIYRFGGPWKQWRRDVKRYDSAPQGVV